MPDYSVRSINEEIMDDLTCSGEVVRQTLRELEVINRLLGGNNVTIDGIAKLLETGVASMPVVIADLGCGGGDILKLIALWSRKKKIDVHLLGVDANAHITAFAKENTKDIREITYLTENIFSTSFQKREFDIVAGTLFFHHFSAQQLEDFFRQLKTQVRVGIIINDIHRHWFAYHSIRLLTKVFSKSSMVKYDAPLSVLRAFKKKDWIGILQRAGITNYTIRWRWAFRWQIIIKC
jgi:2-polyprenyl-3-methyl-5-hydroxy-6-metoxy-1,4-benzoquinol methylase